MLKCLNRSQIHAAVAVTRNGWLLAYFECLKSFFKCSWTGLPFCTVSAFISSRNALILLSGILSILINLQGIHRLHEAGPQTPRSLSEPHLHWHCSRFRQQDRTLRTHFVTQHHTSIKADYQGTHWFPQGWLLLQCTTGGFCLAGVCHSVFSLGFELG